MTITLSLGWWVLPLAITLVAVPLSMWNLGRYDKKWDILAPFGFLLSVIVSLTAWLIWAVLT